MTTQELCIRVGELGLWPGADNPKKWNEEHSDENIEFNRYGWKWICDNEGTIIEKWRPNPGRKAMMLRVLELKGEEWFEQHIGKGKDRTRLHQDFTHEQWLEILIKIGQKEL